MPNIDCTMHNALYALQWLKYLAFLVKKNGEIHSSTKQFKANLFYCIWWELLHCFHPWSHFIFFCSRHMKCCCEWKEKYSCLGSDFTWARLPFSYQDYWRTWSTWWLSKSILKQTAEVKLCQEFINKAGCFGMDFTQAMLRYLISKSLGQLGTW